MKKMTTIEMIRELGKDAEYNYFHRLSRLEIDRSEYKPEITHFVMRKITVFGKLSEPKIVSKKFALKHYEEVTSDCEREKYAFFHV